MAKSLYEQVLYQLKKNNFELKEKIDEELKELCVLYPEMNRYLMAKLFMNEVRFKKQRLRRYFELSPNQRKASSSLYIFLLRNNKNDALEKYVEKNKNVPLI